jgi:hypothetical protein
VHDGETAVPGRIYPQALAGKQNRGYSRRGEIGGGRHKILQRMVQEDDPETSIRVQPETP